MNAKYIRYGMLAIGVLVAFAIHAIIGIVVLIVIGVIWGAGAEKSALVKQYGPEMADKIKKKQVEVGMTREVVERMWGPGGNIKKHVDAEGTTITGDYVQYERDGRKRYRYYAVFTNDVLTSYGDR